MFYLVRTAPPRDRLWVEQGAFGEKPRKRRRKSVLVVVAADDPYGIPLFRNVGFLIHGVTDVLYHKSGVKAGGTRSATSAIHMKMV